MASSSSSSRSTSRFIVEQEELKLFHTIDRELYTILVIHLCRDPLESMQVMALWLWFERIGYENMVKKMLILPYILINELADEALTCLHIIKVTTYALLPSDHISFITNNYNDIPLIQTFMEKEMSLQFFHENFIDAAHGVTKAAYDVCLPAFDDIFMQAVQRNYAGGQISAGHHSQVMLSSEPSSSSSSPSTSFQQHHQLLVPPNERTMFVTFSKGYPVHEHEVEQFFNTTFGECVESVHMQDVQPSQQALFARVVLHSPSTIETVLHGTLKAKFTINGKHVWVRKFVPRCARNLLPPMLW